MLILKQPTRTRVLSILPTVVTSVVLIGAALILTSITTAQTPESGFDATVSPTFFDVAAEPGESISDTLRIRNNTNETITLNAQVNTLGPSDTGELTIRDENDESVTWIELSDTSFSIPPREWQTIRFTINIPDDAAYGYYYALSFTEESEEDNVTGATVNASIVVPVLLNAQQDGAKTEGELAEFKTESFYYEYLPTTFLTTFENTGNVHIRPRGNIFIEDFLGRQVGVLEVNEGNGAILPNMSRTYTTDWSDSFVWYEPKMDENGAPVVDENGNPERELKFDFTKVLDLRIGKYTATEVLIVSGNDRDYTYESVTTFFVFPWKIVIGIVIVAILAGVGLWSTIKSIFHRIKRLFK